MIRSRPWSLIVLSWLSHSYFFSFFLSKERTMLPRTLKHLGPTALYISCHKIPGPGQLPAKVRTAQINTGVLIPAAQPGQPASLRERRNGFSCKEMWPFTHFEILSLFLLLSDIFLSLSSSLSSLFPFFGAELKEKHLIIKTIDLKRPWCWERLKTGGEGDHRGWDGWMASLTQWTWVWVDSRSWWQTGRPGVLQFMSSQRVGHDWATELNWTEKTSPIVYSGILWT